jgi:DNA mismatch repair protein MutS2
MAQSGLHVPAREGTRLGFFRRVFADIGDEQSIEQSLSTFSGHMKNIVAILREAGPDSLVLLDELGAGTDPVEGAALAQAILERLQEKGVKTVATTHYSELKNFAHARERVENACVEFDAVTLMPTYRLITGRPGGSQAFAIARRLGMDAALVERARSFLSAEQVVLTDLLAELEEKRQLAAREREEARRAREEALALKERYAELERSLRERRQEILGGAAREARQIVRRAREEAEEIVREMRARASEEASAERERAIYELRRRIREAEDRLVSPEPGEPDGARGEAPENVRPGQEVYLPRFRQQGCVVAAAGEGQFVVQVGAVKLTLPKDEMRLAEKSEDSGQGQKPKGAGLLMAEKAKEVSVSVSVRGMRVAEALEVVEKYLDDAVLAGLPRVYVIHGKGTGTLRSVIQEQLKKDRRVKSFRLGEHGEGGAGVTVVELA